MLAAQQVVHQNDALLESPTCPLVERGPAAALPALNDLMPQFSPSIVSSLIKHIRSDNPPHAGVPG